MKHRVHFLPVTLMFSFIFGLNALSDEADFVEERGKALNNIKVMPGSKRTNIDFHTVEQEAGKAVLKLLDAKIGKKVDDAAKEVTDFLNDAVDHHAKQRAIKLQSDKQKELSLLHLGTKNILTNRVEDKPQKNKDGSFLVHFKIPYLVTPVEKKKEEPKEAKKVLKDLPKSGKKIHLKKMKKYHHRILHHHRHYHHHRHHHHHAHAQDVAKQPASAPPTTISPQTQAVTAAIQPLATQPQQTPPNYNSINLNFNGYNWTYSLSNDTQSDMIPCQGSCMDPCTADCSLDQDCCCCPSPSMMMSQPPMMAAPAAYPAVVAEAQPVYQQPLVMAPLPSCPPTCRVNCFSECPRECCGVAGKRDEVAENAGSGSDADMDNMEEGSGSEVDVKQQSGVHSQAKDSDNTQVKYGKEQDNVTDAGDGGSSDELEEMDY